MKSGSFNCSILIKIVSLVILKKTSFQSRKYIDKWTVRAESHTGGHQMDLLITVLSLFATDHVVDMNYLFKVILNFHNFFEYIKHSIYSDK